VAAARRSLKVEAPASYGTPRSSNASQRRTAHVSKSRRSEIHIDKYMHRTRFMYRGLLAFRHLGGISLSLSLSLSLYIYIYMYIYIYIYIYICIYIVYTNIPINIDIYSCTVGCSEARLSPEAVPRTTPATVAPLSYGTPRASHPSLSIYI